MPLIEIVHGAATDAGAVQAAIGFARQLDKLPLPCRSAPGLHRQPRAHALPATKRCSPPQEGVPLALIDRPRSTSACRWAPSSSPTSSASTWPSTWARSSPRELQRPVTQVARLRELIAAKKLGRKSGAGFYAGRTASRQAAGLGRSAPADLIDRLILVLVNECVACLRERVVEDADLVDAAVIFGTGFAPFRGGPLTYARAAGYRRSWPA